MSKNSNNVVTLYGGAQPQPIAAVAGFRRVIPFASKAIADACEVIHLLEAKLHVRVIGLVEAINRIDQALLHKAEEAAANEKLWAANGYVTHRPFVSAPMFYCIQLVSAGGETVLCAVALEGLSLPMAETYIGGLALAGLGSLLSRAAAYGLRGLQGEQEPAARRRCIFMIGGSVVLLATMMAGMGYARMAYAELDAAGGGSGWSTTALAGLLLLQTVLYAGQTVVFYFWLPANLAADQARRNYLNARQALQNMLQARAKAAAKLNAQVNKFFAERYARTQAALEHIADYVRRVHAAGKSALLDGYDMQFDDALFTPVAARVPRAVDGPPPLVQEVMSQPINKEE